MTRYVIRVGRFARQAGIALLFVLAALGGTLSGVVFAYIGDLPQIRQLDDYTPSTITRVHALGGEVIGEFAVQRRVVVSYDDISPTLRQAIIAAEDSEFASHVGLSISRIFVTLIRDVLQGRAAGASTLTQQLARNLFPESIGFQKTLERKIKEAIVAIQVEKRYTKNEILTLYCNQIYLGHGAYGMEAAARLYFGKSAKDVTLDEAALLAGIIQSPERQSPFVDMQRALRRRNYVLERMADEGMVSLADAETARKRPIDLRGPSAPGASPAPYFVEEVRKYLEAKYGAKRLYESGLTVQTSLDLRLQEAANRAIDAGLRALDKRRGFRKPATSVLAAGSLDEFAHGRWQFPIVPGDIVPAAVTEVVPQEIRIRIGRLRGSLSQADYSWTGRRDATSLVKAGDLVEIRIGALNDATGTLTGTLEQTPLVEGGLVAIDNRTGQVRAMVGGYSFERSKFNRATQAYRQLGSVFKPIVYAAAIDRGYTASTSLLDAPVSYEPGPGQPPYAPKNYDHTYLGPMTLRRALEKSRNVPTIRLMDELGPDQVVNYAKRLGFESPLQPFLSTALGASEAPLLEVTSAYSTFANQGVRMKPYFILKITDRDGNVLEENRPEPRNAIRADTAYVMTSLLRGVVLRGTAVRAASIDWPLAGKTGTVDDYTDAWFVGFDPTLTAGVWIGHDEKKTLGYGEDGARAALPMWIDFMKVYIEGREHTEFTPPGNIIVLAVDRDSGQPTSGNAPGAIPEVFIAGTQPGAGFPRE